MILSKNKVLFLIGSPVIIFFVFLYVPWTIALIKVLTADVPAPYIAPMDDPKWNIIPYSIFLPVVLISNVLSFITIPTSIIYYAYFRFLREIKFNTFLLITLSVFYILFLVLFLNPKEEGCGNDKDPRTAMAWLMD